MPPQTAARSGSAPGDPQVQHRNKHIVKHDIQNAPRHGTDQRKRRLLERRQEEAASRELEDKREQAQTQGKLKELVAISLKVIACISMITVAASFVLTKPLVSIFARPDNPVYDLAVTGNRICTMALLFIGTEKVSVVYLYSLCTV